MFFIGIVVIMAAVFGLMYWMVGDEDLEFEDVELRGEGEAEEYWY